MGKYRLVLATALIVALIQPAFAARCEQDTESPVGIETAVLNFDPINWEQAMTVTNNADVAMIMYVFIPGGKGLYWGGYPGYGWGYPGYGQGYGRGYGRGNGYGDGWFEGVGCDGDELASGETCTINVYFFPGKGSEKRQYHKKMTVGGVTPDGEFAQTVCLDATN